MSSKKITKDTARKVSIKIAAVSFDDRVEKARKKAREYSDKLIETLVPKEVLEVTKTCGKYFRTTNMFGVRCPNRLFLYAETNYTLPDGLVLVVGPKEYDKLKENRKGITDVCKQRDDFGATVYNALCDLKTAKKIREQLPEVIPYLALFQNVDDETPKESNYIESIRKGIVKPKKDEQK